MYHFYFGKIDYNHVSEPTTADSITAIFFYQGFSLIVLLTLVATKVYNADLKK